MPNPTLPVHGLQLFSAAVTAQSRTSTRQQQARERLELRALSLGADHTLAQLAADAWLAEVAL